MILRLGSIRLVLFLIPAILLHDLSRRLGY
jgi:hypothetical protein